VFLSEKACNNQVGIFTNRPYIKVSWQVIGIRKDVSVQTDRIQVEVDKPDHGRGTLDPTAIGLGEEFGIYIRITSVVMVTDTSYSQECSDRTVTAGKE
jgi:hypothetical protein